MDKLEQIFVMQKALNDDIQQRRDLHFSQEEWIQKTILATISELAEVLDESNFKWWKNPKELDYKAIKEEMVDILHFLVGMSVNVGMTAQEMFDIYYAKNKENFDRQNGLSQKKGYELSQKNN